MQSGWAGGRRPPYGSNARGGGRGLNKKSAHTYTHTHTHTHIHTYYVDDWNTYSKLATLVPKGNKTLRYKTFR